MLPRTSLLFVLLLLVSTANSADPAIQTTQLPLSAEGMLREPTLAFDPNDPSRMLVAAMFRGTEAIWTWRSTDGGRSWLDGRLEAPKYPGVDKQTIFAADVIAGFTSDGTPLLTWLSGRPEGGTFASRVTMTSLGSTAAPMARNSLNTKAQRYMLQDKPWMVIDRSARSRHRGAVYVTVSDMPIREATARSGERWAMDEVVQSRLMLAVSRDQGRTFSAPKIISTDSAFAGYLALTPDGTLEISYLRMTSNTGAGNTLFHVSSRDGGATFSPPIKVATTGGKELLASNVLAARPNGDLLVCWSQGVPGADTTNQVNCAKRKAGESWGSPRDIGPSLASDVVAAWPTVVGTEHGWYLMLYLLRPTHMEVALFKSADGAAFSKLATLASVDGVGVGQFTLALWSSHRHDREAFSIGHYLALDAARGRLAAAYVLPKNKTAGSIPAIYVSTLDEPAS